MKNTKKLDSSMYLSLALSYFWERPLEIFQAFRDKNMSALTRAGRSIPGDINGH